jgi:DedD protein
MTETADINVDELRRRARRRLVGAVVLALAVAVIVPMLLETEQKPLGEDVSVRIPPVDNDKFVNRISEARSKDAASAEQATPAKDESARGAGPAAPSTERPPKYDTRLPESAPASVPPAPPAERMASSAAPPAQPSTPSPVALPAPGPAEGAKPSTPMATVPSAAAPAPAVSPTKAAPESPHEGYAVQLAAFADDKGANVLAGRLKKAGYATYTEPLKTSKGTLWRVRVGPYPSREAALAARDKLKTEGHSGIVAAAR